VFCIHLIHVYCFDIVILATGKIPGVEKCPASSIPEVLFPLGTWSNQLWNSGWWTEIESTSSNGGSSGSSSV